MLGWIFGSRKKVAHPDSPLVYYVQGRIFTPGTRNFAYESTLQHMPTVSVNGPGRIAGSLNSLQTPQVYSNLAVPTSSVQGTQAGQIFGSPLLNADLTPLE